MKKTGLFMVGILMLQLAAVMAVGCNDGCTATDTRCNGKTVQECNADGDWYSVLNCEDSFVDLWTCCDPGWVDTDGAEVAGCCPVEDADGGR